jgi:putative ATP-binding cassette transporter
MRWRAVALLALLLVFMLCLNGLNVAATIMCGDFMTAVSERAADSAVVIGLLWAGTFAVLTVVAVFKAFTEDRFRLQWRQWLTRHLFERYLSGRAYYRLQGRSDVDNPDQRITEDVKTFTEQTLALLLIIANSTITLISFSGILWSITPWLFLAAVLYTVFGSILTVFVGRRLLKLDVLQFRKEADLRYDLIQTRTHAERIALLGGEREETGRLRRRLAAVVSNLKGIIGLSRNIAFFTTGYDYLSQLIPLLIVAPLYIRGQVEFGKLAQAQIAFLYVMGAFSIIVKEFQRISTFGAVVERLGTFWEVLDGEAPGLGMKPVTPPGPGLGPLSPHKSPIETIEDSARVAFEGLTLTTPRDSRLLVRDLGVEAPYGQRLLILGPSGSGRTCLIRAVAGLWLSGQGRIVRPPLDEILFLPQQPYLRAGPFRDQLLYGTRHDKLSDSRLLAALRKVQFEEVLERVGGLDAVGDWSSTLSQGEQQQLSLARLLLASPRFAFLDEPTSALDADLARRIYATLAKTSITYISITSDERLRDYHDRVVELGPDGTWTATEPLLECA